MRILISDTNWATCIIAHDLRSAGFYVTIANDGAELIEIALNGMQDAVLFDLDLPDMRGKDILHSLRAILPHTPICATAAQADIETQRMMMDLGASTLIRHDTDPAVIAAQLRAYVRRSAGFSTPIVRTGHMEVNLTTQSVQINGTPMQLTRFEYEVIEMLTLRGGSLSARETITSQLDAWEEKTDTNMIDVHLGRIRSKMAALGATEEVFPTRVARGFRIASQEATSMDACSYSEKGADHRACRQGETTHRHSSSAQDIAPPHIY